MRCVAAEKDAENSKIANKCYIFGENHEHKDVSANDYCNVAAKSGHLGKENVT